MSSPRHPVLTFGGGPRDGETAPIDKPVTKLGRMDDNDVVTKGAGVSRQHATIMQNDEGCWLTDLNSRNGTFINGRNISDQRQQLHHGDHIRLGTSTVSLIFRHDESETVALQISAPLEEVADEEVADEELAELGPRERIIRYLQGHPEGANYETLESITGVRGRRIAQLLAGLVEEREVRQQGLRFFGFPEHFCVEHDRPFVEREVAGHVHYAHELVAGWCYEIDPE